MAFHQVVPVLSAGDAVSQQALELQGVLSRFGPSRLFLAERAGELDVEFTDYRRYRHRHGDVLVYHHCTGGPVADRVAAYAAAGVPVVIVYHNITPSKYFAAYSAVDAGVVAQGLAQIDMLGRHAVAWITPSAYNRGDLAEHGIDDVDVVPLILTRDYLSTRPDPGTLSALEALEGPRLLFVGRLAPNKRQDLLAHAFAIFREVWAPNAVLHLVGGRTFEAYVADITRAIDAAHIDGITVTGSLTLAQLLAHYAGADLFVSASEHEGFCVPVLEALHFGLPVVARPGGAVAETLGGAGLVIDSDDAATLAASWGRMLSSPDMREACEPRRQQVLERLAPQVVREQWGDVFARIAERI